jgi:MFS family permease
MSSATLGHYSLGQFMAPLEHAFGWSRLQVSMGMSLSLILSFFLAPVIGRTVDVMNARILAIAGLILTATVYASFSLANGNVTLWVALWFVHNACTTLISPVVWLSAIPGTFSTSRSFATAVALSGTSLSVAFAPTLAQYLINLYDWRIAFRLMAVIWFGVALALTLTCFFDRRPKHVRKPAATTAQDAITRREDRRVLRGLFLSATFLKLTFVVFGVFLVDAAYMVHLAPALMDKGFVPLDAAKLVGVSGLAAIGGKLFVGWLFDRMPFDVVSAGTMAMLALSCVLFVPLHGQLMIAMGACIALGLAIGAMYTVIACLTGQLFPAETFGLVFGVLTSSMALASAIGPMLGSFIHDQLKSYDTLYVAGVGVAIVSALILRTLKPANVPAAPMAVSAE